MTPSGQTERPENQHLLAKGFCKDSEVTQWTMYCLASNNVTEDTRE